MHDAFLLASCRAVTHLAGMDRTGCLPSCVAAALAVATGTCLSDQLIHDSYEFEADREAIHTCCDDLIAALKQSGVQ